MLIHLIQCKSLKFCCLEYFRAFANPEPLEISSSYFEERITPMKGGGGSKSLVHKHMLLDAGAIRK